MTDSFPWFRAKADDPKAPAHGFVRTREWQLYSVILEADGTVTASLLNRKRYLHAPLVAAGVSSRAPGHDRQHS